MPVDLSKIVELLPLVIGGARSGSPEGQALMRGWLRAQEQLRQQHLQEQQLEEQRAYRSAQMGNLAADNRRAEESLGLQRDAAGLNRLEKFRTAGAERAAQLAESATEPLPAQNQLAGDLLTMSKQYGVDPAVAQTVMPNMGQQISTRKKKVAKELYEQAEKRFGPEAMASDAITIQTGEVFGDMKPSQLRAIFEAPAMTAQGQPAQPYVKPTREPLQRVETIGKDGRPVTKFVTETEAAGKEFPQYVKPEKTEPKATDEYAQERQSRNLASVDELLGKVNNWTTGVGSGLARFPATDARNFAAALDTLKANIAFGELAAMRSASKTGGALGQVSERELALLQSALGALDTGQSPAAFKAQLQKIRDSLQRWQLAQSGVAQPGRTGGSAADSALEILNQRRRLRKP